ncbi:ACP S-malonyltransferase [Paenibacillus durus]|uniref:[acyl-carrier-protein] S-malonyltransferase n=1 Tax=Paenibacillus durus TaxID=44251 RepID=A0A089HRH0_PAEDU|nr:ACP S-malonyltransferase [Paenibacillus durus]AIQ12923.1 malonyl CoA-ACP transacylase [Paenibacillus durus]
MTTYLFPGQGSQFKGMGEELFENFKEYVETADDILGYSLQQLCLEDPERKLGLTQYTQPALYVVNALSYLQVLRETGIKPDYLAGHSLGEYNALFAAEAFDFATGLQLVQRRGRLMGTVSGGGMAAVLGLEEEAVHAILQDERFNRIDIANLNTPKQIVISGPQADIEQAKEVFENAGAYNYVILAVSGAFHSRYMESVKLEFKDYLAGFSFSPLKIPVISNVLARPYIDESVKSILADQITSSVKWTESIRYLMGKGEMEYKQVGPGHVMDGLVKTIQRDAEPLVVVEPMVVNEPKKTAEGIEPEARVQAQDQIQTDSSPLASAPAAAQDLLTDQLGSTEFKEDYQLKYAYWIGAMGRGISSKEFVVAMSKHGMMSCLGTEGLKLDEIRASLDYLRQELGGRHPFAVNVMYEYSNPRREEQLLELLINQGVQSIEASSYISLSAALVKFRVQGLRRDSAGRVVPARRILLKASRPEIAEIYLSPPPRNVVDKLLEEQWITAEEAQLSYEIPMIDDLCVLGDCGGYTDQGTALAIFPLILKLARDAQRKFGYKKRVRIGLGGGLGTPEAAAAAFVLGADFIVTGSINQCTVEANTSELVKDILQQISVQDTGYAPSEHMFEIGARVQVVKKGVFFPVRANKLYETYRQFGALEEISDSLRSQLEDKYFKKSFSAAYQELKLQLEPDEIAKAEQNPKVKMALLFRSYLSGSYQLALKGFKERKVDFQIYSGSALGAFNHWVKGTPLEDWRQRHAWAIGEKIMTDAASLLNERFQWRNTNSLEQVSTKF